MKCSSGMPNWTSQKKEKIIIIRECPVEKCKIRQCVSPSFRPGPEPTPIAGTPSWVEALAWGLEGQRFPPASCCLCAAGEAWVAGLGGPPVVEWRDCGAAEQACGGCSSHIHCKGAGSCFLCGWVRLSCWRQSLAKWPGEAWGRAGVRLWAAQCPRLLKRCSGWGTRCHCCSCRRGRGSWRPGWLTGTQ